MDFETRYKEAEEMAADLFMVDVSIPKVIDILSTRDKEILHGTESEFAAGLPILLADLVAIAQFYDLPEGYTEQTWAYKQIAEYTHKSVDDVEQELIASHWGPIIYALTEGKFLPYMQANFFEMCAYINGEEQPAVKTTSKEIPFEIVRMFFTGPIEDKDIISRAAYHMGYDGEWHGEDNITGVAAIVKEVAPDITVSDYVVAEVADLLADFNGYSQRMPIANKVRIQLSDVVTYCREIQKNGYLIFTPFRLRIFDSYFRGNMSNCMKLLADFGITCLSEDGVKCFGAPALIPMEAYAVDEYDVLLLCMKILNGPGSNKTNEYAILKYVYKDLYGDELTADYETCMRYTGHDSVCWDDYRRTSHERFVEAAEAIHDHLASEEGAVEPTNKEVAAYMWWPGRDESAIQSFMDGDDAALLEEIKRVRSVVLPVGQRFISNDAYSWVVSIDSTFTRGQLEFFLNHPEVNTGDDSVEEEVLRWSICFFDKEPSYLSNMAKELFETLNYWKRYNMFEEGGG